MAAEQRHPDAAWLEACCSRWPGVTRDIKWATRRVYSVDRKMFAITAADRRELVDLYVKVPDERFLELTDCPGIEPAPYLARARWVAIVEPRRFATAELAAFVLESYVIVCAKLSKRRQAELGHLPTLETPR